MERIQGLKEYITCTKYRKAMCLPDVVEETYQLLAQGEYNINYLFTHPITEVKLILRVNCESQMHLPNQIQYEYNALKLLSCSGRTPKPLYVDGSLEKLSYGVMVMEYLPGEALHYRRDLSLAAECLADIHSVRADRRGGLKEPDDPFAAILQECEEMITVYMDSPFGEEGKKKHIRRLLDLAWDTVKHSSFNNGYQCCINTELNSTNFLINGKGKQNYLVDWEKPLYGDPAQDLGHFLAPTTTYWKTDVILTTEEMERFLEDYIVFVGGRFPTEGMRERVHTYLPVTCLRGITWCAMAWVQYQQPDKLIFNESTFQKLKAYLSNAFLEYIERNQFQIG